MHSFQPIVLLFKYFVQLYKTVSLLFELE